MSVQPNKRRLSVPQRIMIVLLSLALIFAIVFGIQWLKTVLELQKRQSWILQTYGFNPGNIISDELFFDGQAMNAEQVQALLDKEGANCVGDQCLRSKVFSVTSQPKTTLCEAYEASGEQTAAQIIAQVGQVCSISQKVLLTILQKEQHLVSATAPDDIAYNSAMGLSCPDDAACDVRYAGFFKQVYGCAERFNYYRTHGSEYHYHAHMINDILYHPNVECGSSKVWIDNDATALLYIYTPYQPNEAALNAGGGEGDSCSSYGNRNFAIIYSMWFGARQ